MSATPAVKDPIFSEDDFNSTISSSDLLSGQTVLKGGDVVKAAFEYEYDLSSVTSRSQGGTPQPREHIVVLASDPTIDQQAGKITLRFFVLHSLSMKHDIDTWHPTITIPIYGTFPPSTFSLYETLIPVRSSPSAPSDFPTTPTSEPNLLRDLDTRSRAERKELEVESAGGVNYTRDVPIWAMALLSTPTVLTQSEPMDLRVAILPTSANADSPEDRHPPCLRLRNDSQLELFSRCVRYAGPPYPPSSNTPFTPRPPPPGGPPRSSDNPGGFGGGGGAAGGRSGSWKTSSGGSTGGSSSGQWRAAGSKEQDDEPAGPSDDFESPAEAIPDADWALRDPRSEGEDSEEEWESFSERQDEEGEGREGADRGDGLEGDEEDDEGATEEELYSWAEWCLTWRTPEQAEGAAAVEEWLQKQEERAEMEVL